MIACTRCWIGSILAHVDFLDEQIADLTEAIEEQIAPFEPAVELLCTIPGVQRRTAEVDHRRDRRRHERVPHRQGTRVVGRAVPRQRPIRRQAPLRPHPQRHRKWLDWALEEAALAATRTNDTYLAAQYARLRPRRGHKKALGAVKHSILVACWHMLSTGELYHDLGGDYFARRDPEKTTKRLVAQLERLGHTRHAPGGRVEGANGIFLSVSRGCGARSLLLCFSSCSASPGAGRTPTRYATAPSGSSSRRANRSTG